MKYKKFHKKAFKGIFESLLTFYFGLVIAITLFVKPVVKAYRSYNDMIYNKKVEYETRKAMKNMDLEE